ncbi:hypothetical protein Taro_021569 [Colocasia esculenta]|uniref:Aminotransferase-like plant mobile domain-containing protein n=1 Tax=Colocasia esculenta TaxID=4460 RepID=A0A843UZ59_COLES|nr:hypothetical protein [Colocasia esculenta]
MRATARKACATARRACLTARGVRDSEGGGVRRQPSGGDPVAATGRQRQAALRGTYLFGASHMLGLDDWQPTESRVLTLIRRAGFNIVRKCSWVKLDRLLLTALVDRWRPETNTFHFPHGEMTITLQDVSCILGLRIDGEPIVAAPHVPTRWPSYLDMCQELLGVDILNLNVLGQYKTCLQMAFLRDTFSQMNLQGHNMHTVRCYTRAYVMYLLGKALIPDTSGNEIHIQYLGFLEDFNACEKLSWGSAVLAYLYRAYVSRPENYAADIHN